MSYTESDPIDPMLRLGWIKEIFSSNPNIIPAIIKDDFDDESLPLQERTKKWAVVINKTYPKIDVIVSSEEYGESFAINLNATHILFDAERKKFPVSASLIREKPFRYWDFIPHFGIGILFHLWYDRIS